MLSVASQVAASIIHRRDAKMSAAASSNDRPTSSPFAEMLDNAAAANDPAPSKAAKDDKNAAMGAEKSTQANEAAGKGDSEPSPQIAPTGKEADPAKPEGKPEEKLSAAANAVETMPKLDTDTDAEATPAKADALAIDLAAFMEAVAAATAPEAQVEQPVEQTVDQAENDAQPAETSDGDVPSAGPEPIVKVQVVVQAAAVQVADVVADPAVATGEAEATAAAKSTPALQAAPPAAGKDKTDAAPVDPALVTEKAPPRQEPAKAESAQAEPVKPDADGAKRADQAPAHSEPKTTAHVNRTANTQHTDAEAKPAATEPAINTSSSAKPDLLPPTQLPAQTVPSTTGSIHSVAPQKDAAAPSTAVPVEGVVVEITSKALEGKNSFEIRLDPPELGRVHVRLDVDRNGEITSHVTADRQETLDLLRRDAPQLERALSEAGLRTAGNGLQFSLRDHGQGQREQQPFADATRIVLNDETIAADTMPRGYYRPAGLAGGLDIRV